MALQRRPPTPEELDGIQHLAQSRAAAAHAVERAKIIWPANRDWRVPAIAREPRLGGDTVRLWLKRFNADGLAGLQDRPRAGRPVTYTAQQVGEVVALSLTDPRSLDLPFACWTLDRLRAYLHEVTGLPISRAQVGKLLVGHLPPSSPFAMTDTTTTVTALASKGRCTRCLRELGRRCRHATTLRGKMQKWPCPRQVTH